MRGHLVLLIGDVVETDDSYISFSYYSLASFEPQRMVCIEATSRVCVIVFAWAFHCASGEYCCDRGQSTIGKCARSCIGEPCEDDNHCGSDESCCDRGQSAIGKCARSCVRKSCTRVNHCASGEYCDGDEKKCFSTHVPRNLCFSDVDCCHGLCCVFNETRKIKRCFTTCIGQPCNSVDDCSTGQCCDDDKKCKSTRNCDRESKRRWKLVVSVGIPVTVIVIIAIAWLYHVVVSS
ncbi:Hypothetical predicted protein [Paramuricea clavata]|uniref:Uncharacterized protein n=1 Tax=Paramuricea clavata TaxID=317549 RepID=A0A7D9L0C8_PARCT|nr:Hypothetical predicted protein [Paramuricea clavata]